MTLVSRNSREWFDVWWILFLVGMGMSIAAAECEWVSFKQWQKVAGPHRTRGGHSFRWGLWHRHTNKPPGDCNAYVLIAWMLLYQRASTWVSILQVANCFLYPLLSHCRGKKVAGVDQCSTVHAAGQASYITDVFSSYFDIGKKSSGEFSLYYSDWY